jgi:RNA-directed DNA polymerase
MNPFHSIGRLAEVLGVRSDIVLALAEEADDLYKPFVDTKSGKSRLIDRPLPRLRAVQRRINMMLLRDYPYSRFAMAGVRKRSVSDAVRPHQRRPVVIRIDIRSFYPSVSDRAVFSVWRKLGYGTNIARLLTRLTTYERRLPQGAPTSLALANLVMEPIDLDVYDSLLPRFPDLRYTRWVDDMVFSGTLDPSIVFGVVAARLRMAGLRAHRAKTKRAVMPSDSPQEILGTIVNAGVSLTRRRRKLMRAIVHNANRFGGDAKVIGGQLAYLKTFHQDLGEQLEDSLRLGSVLFRHASSKRVL